VVLLLAAAIIVAGVIAVAIGRGGELAPAPADFAPLDLTEVTSADVALLRPPSALWGYHREATDEAFGQIARTISDQEVQIATLQRQLADLLPRRTTSATGPLGLGPAGAGSPGMGQPGMGPAETRPVGTGPMGTGPIGTGPMGTGPMGTGPMGTGPMVTRPGGSPFPDLEPPRGMGLPPGMDPPPWMSPPAAVEPPSGTEPPAPSRPSILHRELADQASAAEPPPAEDPWSAWQRRSGDGATSGTNPGTAPGRTAGPGPQAAGPQAAGPPPAADPGEDS
jgi:hypothetical protein